MPITAIDWSGLRAAAVLIGIREAARQAAADMPSDEQTRFVERAMKRCSREGWLEQARAVQASMSAAGPQGSKPVSAPVRKGHEIAENVVKELGNGTKVGLMRVTSKAVKHLEQLDGESIIAEAQNVKAITAVADTLHGWTDKRAQSGGGLLVNVNLMQMLSHEVTPAIDVTADVTRGHEQELD